MGNPRTDIPIFNCRQGDDFTLWMFRGELELKRKKVYSDVSPVPVQPAISIAAPSAPEAPEAPAAPATPADSNDSGDDVYVASSEEGSVKIHMTPEERHDLASYIIVPNLGNRVLRALKILRNDPRLMWLRLKERYAASTLTSKIALQERFLTAKMQPKSKVREHVRNIEACVVLLTDMREQISGGM